MQITIDIPKNDYQIPTDVRSEVVQMICNAFLYGGIDKIFHPYSESGYRPATKFVGRKPRTVNQYGKPVVDRGWFYGFSSYRWAKDHHNPDKGEVYFEFNGAEMKAAFKALTSAGYHMFRVYEYGSWKGYLLDKKPVHDNATEVFDFEDFID